jgi:hypothetical protein
MSVQAEDLPDTPIVAYVAGGLQQAGEITQDIAKLSGVPVNKEAEQSVKTVEHTFKENKTAFIVGKYTAPIIPMIQPVVAVTVVSRPATKLTINYVSANTAEEAISLGSKLVDNTAKDLKLTFPKGDK